MSSYRRYRFKGGCYFFTVNLLERYPNDLLIRKIDLLRESITRIKERYPFKMDGWVDLPDHMHCVWTLPKDDDDFAKRWRLIKTQFSKNLPKEETRSRVRLKREERGIWQRRYWEHYLRDENDYVRHMDYLHINPVKHGYVKRVVDWPHSSFQYLVEKGVYPKDWGDNDVVNLNVGERSEV